ncbi:MAG: carboxypeptidase regulatory-like domain-containing protein, partial [Phycisphaerae bacterium]|nr:carboxypeptidase regulatory-like domain-containing protein [Phycisphaerae bacterium]
VAPGQPVLYSSSGTISKLISQTAPGKFRYRMKHYPSTGKPTRRIEIHRLPPGAKLLKIIPKSATRSIKNGRIEIFVDKIIKPGGSLTVSYNYALSPPPTPKPAPKPSARVYQFAAPNYSLVDEPMRIKPRTLDKGRNADEVSPSEAVVFGWPIRWWSSHWSGPRNTNAVTMAQGKDSVRFVVNPAARKVWVKYFDIPIDPQQYPIAVMTYRAKRTHTTSSGYVLYLDDTSGPDYGGVMPFAQKDIIPDGEVHTISCDLRPMKPIGDLIGLAVGVESAPEGKAEFELLDLRFEAAPGATSRKIELDAPRIVQVVDVSGDPIPGATVTIDAGRSNWARSVKTNADGKATVRGYRTKPGKHMLRVTADGMTPTEVRNLPSDDKQDVRVALQPEAIYRGVVHDADDKPLAGATVKINIPQRRDMSQWMRTTAEVLTNEQGKWESPPLPKTNQKVSLQIFHPDYMIPGVLFRARRSLDDMGQDATPLKVRRKLIILNGQVKNWLGRPVRDATVDVYFPGKAKRVTMRRFVTDGEGNFSMRSKKASVVLVVRAKGYAPVTMQMQLDEENAPLAIKLEPPHTLQGTVVDDEGNPLPDVAVEIMLQHEKVSPRIAKVRTGADGVFRWDGAPKDEVLVTVTKAGYETAKAKMTAGEISQPVELEKAPPVVTEPPKPRLRRKGYDPRNFRNVS